MRPSNITISFGDINFYVMRDNGSCYEWMPCKANAPETTVQPMVNPKDYDNMDDLMRDVFRDTEEGW